MGYVVDGRRQCDNCMGTGEDENGPGGVCATCGGMGDIDDRYCRHGALKTACKQCELEEWAAVKIQGLCRQRKGKSVMAQKREEKRKREEEALLMQRRMLRIQTRHKWLNWLEQDPRRYRTVTNNVNTQRRIERFMEGPRCIEEMIYTLDEFTMEAPPDPNAKQEEPESEEEEKVIGLDGKPESDDLVTRLKQRQEELAHREKKRTAAQSRPILDVTLSEEDFQAVRDTEKDSYFELNKKKKKINSDGEEEDEEEKPKFFGERVGEFDDD